MELKNMKMSEEEKAEMCGPSAIADAPEYPWGLRIDLDDDAIEKLELPGLPQVGQTMIVTARVKVIAVRQNAAEGDEKETGISLQITDMGVGPDSGGSQIDAAKALYGA